MYDFRLLSYFNRQEIQLKRLQQMQRNSTVTERRFPVIFRARNALQSMFSFICFSGISCYWEVLIHVPGLSAPIEKPKLWDLRWHYGTINGTGSAQLDPDAPP